MFLARKLSRLQVEESWRGSFVLLLFKLETVVFLFRALQTLLSPRCRQVIGDFGPGHPTSGLEVYSELKAGDVLLRSFKSLFTGTVGFAGPSCSRVRRVTTTRLLVV